MTNSVYINIQFCNNICSYCDFCKFYKNDEIINKYLDSLENEIDNDFLGEKLNTLYIGGGTPSCLNNNQLNKLFDITSRFTFNDNYEFTIECNIEDIDEEILELFKNNRVNRLSIGVQSFIKKNLNFLDRNKNIDIISRINLAKKYFDNINIDLIYALKKQSIKDLEKDIDIFLSLDLPHISCYSLIIEPHTKISNIKPINDKLDYDMFKLIDSKLKDYNHYEISNYSKKGYESKHNLTYWNNEEYYGFGLSASSYLNNIRYTNYRNLTKYNEKIYKKEKEILSLEDKMKYEYILKFRLKDGINIKDFNKKYNCNILDNKIIKELINEDKLLIENDNIIVNKKYIYVINEILVKLI